MSFSEWYYGMDLASPLSSGSFPCAGDGPNFYLGLIGGETSLRSGYFNETTAAKAGKDHTFPVWDVAGPGTGGGKPSGMSAEEWGITQGKAFINALSSSPYANYIGGLTFFGDIETGNGGWTSGTTTDNNTATLFGFLDVVWGGGPNTAGVYMHPDRWAEFFSSNYTSQIPIVVWAAGPNCSLDCSEAATEFNSTYANMTVGGYKVMIWQYHATTCGGDQDIDITPYAGYQTGKWNPTT